MLRAENSPDGYHPDTLMKLKVWQTKGIEKKFGTWVIIGARQGAAFAEKNIGQDKVLYNINNPQWLRKRFDSYTQNHKTPNLPSVIIPSCANIKNTTKQLG